jgi:hypothetical protein
MAEGLSSEQKQKILDKLLLDWHKANSKLDVSTNSVLIPPNPFKKEASHQGKVLIGFSSEI